MKTLKSSSKTKFISANQIRSLFLDYFKKQHHTIVLSSSLIPGNDPTLLFTNSGMVQFKDVFLGNEERSYKRATSAQRCVRAGGKHNDLENVGHTARHHTFFEMLGNFSFGDYFKREAIQFAWVFLTNILELPPEKLWVTVFKEDTEAENIWLNEIKINPNRFSRCEEHSNFWSMGPTGPCGPCTEIFYDHGETIAGGPPGSPDEDGDRYVEIWNLVFMQYNRATDGSLTPLPKPSVDTGMGLERVAAVMQGVQNNYDIDLFRTIIQFIANLANQKDLTNTSLRVIADHIRSCSFLIADGVIPSNDGRGYVLRRIIRRALRHGNKLGLTEPFFYRVVKPLVDEMGEAYPELTKAQSHIEKVLHQEEEQFNITLSQGLKLFEQAISEIKNTIIPGEIIFKLYDTYGFPVDLTADIAREKNLHLDLEGFETLMNEQRNRSRQSSKFDTHYVIGENIHSPTEFTGYEIDANDKGKIIAIYSNGELTQSLKAGEKGSIILDRTPFYAESGGQVGDQGILQHHNNLYRVENTIKQGQTHLHIGFLEKGNLSVGDIVDTKIDETRRAATILNHTATHILHMVLKNILGSHVIQKGSLVEPERLRFDFSHSNPLTQIEIKTIEKKVNEEIRTNHPGIVNISSLDEAMKNGAIGLFENKYGDEVRVVSFGNSKELCGGTHAHYTGDIGIFKITSESGVAAGIRRIEAVTGEYAFDWIEKNEQELQQKLTQAEERSKLLEKQIDQLKEKIASHVSEELLAQTREINGIKILAAQIEAIDTKSLRTTVDQLKNKLGNAIIALACINQTKVSIVTGVTHPLSNKIKAGELVNKIATHVGGKGGGRPDLAEAGGNQPENLAKALESVYSWVQEKLAH